MSTQLLLSARGFLASGLSLAKFLQLLASLPFERPDASQETKWLIPQYCERHGLTLLAQETVLDYVHTLLLK